MSYLKFSFGFMIIFVSFMSWMINSWLTLWMLMEVMLLLFMGLLTASLNYSVVELMIKYFLIQALTGLLLAGSLALSLLVTVSFINFLFIVILLIKLGQAPFHSWLISVLGKINWLGFFFMSTVLKLVPVLMISYVAEVTWLGPVVGLSVLVGSLLGVNELQAQKLLGYSGMVSVAWLVYSTLGGFFFFFFYWISYTFSLSLLCYFFSSMGIFYLSQFKFVSFSLEFKILCLFLALSFAGIPPFLGFLVKWVLCYFMLFIGVNTLVWLLVLMSLLSTFYYLQLWFYVLLLFSFELKWYSFNFGSFFWMVLFWGFNYLMLLIYLIS